MRARVSLAAAMARVSGRNRSRQTGSRRSRSAGGFLRFNAPRNVLLQRAQALHAAGIRNAEDRGAAAARRDRTGGAGTRVRLKRSFRWDGFAIPPAGDFSGKIMFN